jgi:hypothetical protein
VKGGSGGRSIELLSITVLRAICACDLSGSGISDDSRLGLRRKSRNRIMPGRIA